MNEKDFDEVSAGYALNALSDDERRAVERALASRPEWTDRVDRDAETAALLSEMAPPVTPPAEIRDALLARIAVTPQHPAVASPDDADSAAAGPAPVAPAVAETVEEQVRAAAPQPAGVAARASRRWFTLAASVVLIVGLGFGTVVVAQQLTPPAAVVALEQIEQAPDAASASVALAGGGEATAHWSVQAGQVVLVSDGLPAVASDQTYELWYVRDGGPVSAGTFTASDGAATAKLSGEMHTGDIIAVTVEQAGGSPSGSPTSEPIVAIPTA